MSKLNKSVPVTARKIASLMPKAQEIQQAVDSVTRRNVEHGEVINNLPPAPVSREELKAKYVELAREGNNWVLGELANTIAGQHIASLVALDVAAGLSKGHTYKLSATWAAFPTPATRDEDATWTAHNNAREAVASLNRQISRANKAIKETDRTAPQLPVLRLTPVEAMTLIKSQWHRASRSRFVETLIVSCAPELSKHLADQKKQADEKREKMVNLYFGIIKGKDQPAIVATTGEHRGIKIGRAAIPVGAYPMRDKYAPAEGALQIGPMIDFDE